MGRRKTPVEFTDRKRYIDCNEVKMLTEFYKDKRSLLGRHSRCKSCYKARYAETSGPNKAQSFKRWRLRLKESDPAGYRAWIRRVHIKQKYGITEEDYTDMLIRQMGACAICGYAPKEDEELLAIDHCHATGIVRGLLCGPCNRLLGNAKDKIAVLKNAVKYLKRFEAS